MALNVDLIGGAEGDRTPDLMTASHALSQLSYGPIFGLYLLVILKESSLAPKSQSSYGFAPITEIRRALRYNEAQLKSLLGHFSSSLP